MSFPIPEIYYPMNINDVNMNNKLVNWASGTPVYDASIRMSSYISQKNYKCGIGSWESPKKTISAFSPATILTNYTNTLNTGISVSQNQCKMIVSSLTYMYYFTRLDTNAAWSTSTLIPGSASGSYYRCGLTADGTRGVACIYVGLVYVFDWTGAIPSNWRQTSDTSTREYYGLAITPDGSRMVASTNTNIFFSTWNTVTSNYNAFTQTLNTITPTSAFIGIGISATGDRIAYGMNISTANNWYIAFWNGTNYNNSIILQYNLNLLYYPRTAYFSNDASILFLSYANNTNASIYYGIYNPTRNSYESFTNIATTNIPANLDIHGLCYIDVSNNGVLYINSYANTPTYMVTVTYMQPSFADQIYITLPTLPTTICGNVIGSGFTVATWFRSNFNKHWARIFDFGNGSTSSNILLGINTNIDGTGDLVYAVVNGANITQTRLLTAYLINDNTWHHIAITSTFAASNSATSNVIFYLDGVSISDTNNIFYYPTSISRTTNYIGKSNWTNDPQYYGNIDDFRWYASVLTPAQITSIYTNDPIINSFVNYQNCTIYNVGGATTNVTSTWGSTQSMGTSITYYYWIDPNAATATLANYTNPICFSYTYNNINNLTSASLYVMMDDTNGGYVLVNDQYITLASKFWSNTISPTSINLIPGNNSFKFYCVNDGNDTAMLAVYVINGGVVLFNTNSVHTGWTATITGFLYQNIPLNALINVSRTNPTGISSSSNYICGINATARDIIMNLANASISPYSTFGYNANGNDLTTTFYTIR
jgi:hypothetical protein